jgi:endonuclease-3
MRVLKDIPASKRLSEDQIRLMIDRFLQANPKPKLELYYTNAFTLLVAVVLSAQSTDRIVNTVTYDLFAKYNTPEHFIELGEMNLRRLIKNIGLYRSKASYILESSRLLVAKFNSVVPDNMVDLCKLPGVGHKSACVILNSYFNKPEIAVDTHVKRVATRIGLTEATTSLGVWHDLNNHIPQDYKSDIHLWLVNHGRYICKAKKVHCGKCIISDICLYEKKKF